MKTIADAITEHVQAMPTPDQIKLLRATDPGKVHAFCAYAIAGRPDLQDAVAAFLVDREPQLLGRFLVWHSDFVAPDMPVCEVEDCGQVATGQDPGSVRDRDVCDRHGEFVGEPSGRVA